MKKIDLIKTNSVTIQKTVFRQTVQYDQQQQEYTEKIVIKKHHQTQSKQRIMYSLLHSIFRKAIRKPFQKMVVEYCESNSQQSIEAEHMISLFELEIIQENIASVTKLYRQKLLLDGFLSIKHFYERKLKIQATYYNYENLYKFTEQIVSFEKRQNQNLIWQAFIKFCEQNSSVEKLQKINLSQIDIVNNDFTSKELEEFRPFIGERAKQIEIINSYIIDQSNEDQSQLDNSNIDNKFRKIEVKNSRDQLKINDYKRMQSQEIKRKPINQSSNRAIFKATSSQLQKGTAQKHNQEDKVLVTERKGGHYEAQTTRNKPKLQQLEPVQTQHIYLIRDYRSKKKEPSNYVKIPVHTDNIKIVQINTNRKKNKSTKVHVSRKQIQIEQQICDNCKYCIMTRERKQIMKNLSQRVQYLDYADSLAAQLSAR